MSVRIRAQNFQSIEDAEIVVEGLTVLTGTNNAGKTAFVRAFFGVFTNPSLSENLVRVGASHTEVSVSFDDGNTLVWKKGKEKGKNVNQYTINGVVFDNVDRGAPEEALAFGVHSVECGKEELWPQIAMQQDNVSFVLNRPGSLVAEAVVADIDKVSRLNRALGLAEKDKRSLRSETKVRQADLEELKTKLARVEPVSKTLDSVRDFSPQGLKDTQRGLRFLGQKLGVLEGLRGKLGVFRGLPASGPDTPLKKAAGTLLEIQDMQRVGVAVATTRKKLTALGGVAGLTAPSVDLPDLSGMARVADLIRRDRDLRGAVSGAVAEIAKVEAQIQAAEQEDAEFLGQFGGVCPLCNSSISQT